MDNDHETRITCPLLRLSRGTLETTGASIGAPKNRSASWPESDPRPPILGKGASPSLRSPSRKGSSPSRASAVFFRTHSRLERSVLRRRRADSRPQAHDHYSKRRSPLWQARGVSAATAGVPEEPGKPLCAHYVGVEDQIWTGCPRHAKFGEKRRIKEFAISCVASRSFSRLFFGPLAD